MPSYYNPYNFFPATYQNAYSGMYQPQPVQQSGTAQPLEPMKWIEGEVGAKAYQMPQGLPANTPIPLWDSTDTMIYLKSWSPMGIPNPIQKLRYEILENQNQQLLTQGQSGSSEMDELRNEIKNLKEIITQLQDKPNQNKGGSRQ